MSTELATVDPISRLAETHGMSREQYWNVVKATVIPSGANTEQIQVFLAVASRYGLDPLTRQVYAFAGKSGGIVPIVGVDGWIALCNSHPQFDGIEFAYHEAGGNLDAVSCTIWRRDRNRPTIVTEYMSECRRDTEPWRRWPRRMLRHKALMQCARVAFGFSGIYDEDEGREASDAEPVKRVAAEPIRTDSLTRRLAESVAIEQAKRAPAETVDANGEVKPAAATQQGEPGDFEGDNL